MVLSRAFGSWAGTARVVRLWPSARHCGRGVAATMLGGPWMGAVGMSRSTEIGPEFQAFDFTHDRRTYEVFRGGSGPAVLVLHEIPGLHPGVIDFARRLIAAGYSVYLPSLFGRPAAPANGREIVRSILRVCVAREFTKLADRTSPVVGWLRALAASAYRECGGPESGWSGCASPEVSRWRQRSNRRSSRPS